MRTIKNAKSTRKSIIANDSVASVETGEASNETQATEANQADAGEPEVDWSEHISTEKTEKFKHKITAATSEGPVDLFVTDEYARVLVATEEGKAARKEVRSSNGAKRKLTKVEAEKERAAYRLQLKKFASILEQHGINVSTEAMSQPIYVKKDAMTIRGVTFKSPIGMGGARYYINHSAKKNPKVLNPEYLNNLLEFGQLVSLAASIAAQEAGIRAMKALAGTYGIDLAGLGADDEGSDDAE